MIIGIGVDIESPARFRRMMRRPVARRLEVFSPGELRIIEEAADPLVQMTAAFAFKEAMFKALGGGWLDSNLFWRDIELLSDLSDRGEIAVRIVGSARARFHERGGRRIHAACSASRDVVLAQAILEGEGSG